MIFTNRLISCLLTRSCAATFFLLVAQIAFCQIETTISGHIFDVETSKPIDVATAFVRSLNKASQTDEKGFYSISVPAGRELLLEVNRLGYKPVIKKINAIPIGSNLQIDIDMALENSRLEVVIRESVVRNNGMIRENMDNLKLLPSVSGNFESILPHIALGTSTGTGGELTSQYNVRGGNYDENLVYVNDFEIYRPQLVRSGVQEGLSFPNVDLMRDLSFSSGGFEARYGDKQSSVLDIKYKRPDSLKGSASVSLLGATAHVEGSKRLGNSNYRRFTYLVGARYKTNRYLLNSLPVKGEYVPDFGDVQAYFSYDLSKNWQLGAIGNYNTSLFRFAPQSSSAATGLINFALRLNASFEGTELDNFRTGMGGVSLTYLPERKKNPMFIKFMASNYRSLERETFDILDEYRLSVIETGLGAADKGKEIAQIGNGEQQRYARNLLLLDVKNIEVKGGIEYQKEGDVNTSHFIQWGIKAQHEDILDRINDWEKLDSALYNLNHTEKDIVFKRVLKTQNDLQSNKLAAYLQDEYTTKYGQHGEVRISGGLRANYRSLNKEFFVNPRAQLLLRPDGDKDITYRFAAGLYYQPPFYREMRNPNGEVNTGLLSQKSLHALAGFTYDFIKGTRNPVPYRLVVEGYYKKLWDQVTYDIDNVRVQYSGQNDSKGYVTGLDLRLNGEFVKGAESWFNLSFLRARESINGITHMYRSVGDSGGHAVSDVPRPTNQFLTFSTYFQDYLPNNPNLKVNLGFTLGTGQPFGIPGNNIVYRNTYRYQAYHRVDLGFSYALWDKKSLSRHPNNLFRFAENAWLSVEIYNLLQVQNVASNTWIKSIYNVQYAIPNYLTSRRVNVRFKIGF